MVCLGDLKDHIVKIPKSGNIYLLILIPVFPISVSVFFLGSIITFERIEWTVNDTNDTRLVRLQ